MKAVHWLFAACSLTAGVTPFVSSSTTADVITLVAAVGMIVCALRIKERP